MTSGPKDPISEVKNIENKALFNLNIRGPIKILTLPKTNKTIKPNSLDLDIGTPQGIKLKIGGKDTPTCSDSGAGANAIQQAYLRNSNIQILETIELPNPIKLQVGNSEETAVGTAVLLDVTPQDTPGISATMWFLVVENLPLKALIGKPTMKRIGLHTNEAGKPIWRGLLLQEADLSLGLNTNTPFFDKSPTAEPPKVAKANKRYEVLPRSMRHIQLKVDNISGPQGYFIPNENPKGVLYAVPGLTSFDPETKLASILLINPSSQKRNLTPKTVLGKIYTITDGDVEETELIEFGNRSLTDVGTLNKGPDSAKEKEDLPEELARPTRPTRNVKVGMNYFKALPEHWFEEDDVDPDNHLVSPIPVQKLLKRKASKDYWRGYLEDKQPSKEISGVDQVISMMTMQQQSHSKPPDDPVKKKVYEDFELNKSSLNSEQLEELIDMLLEFKDIWDPKRKEEEIQHTKATECEINTTSKAPLRCKAPRRTPVEDYIIWTHIQKMEKRKVIRKSTSPWASPILLADKKNGNIRFCVDYRRLNNVTIQDAYPLPRMDDILSVLGQAKYFTTLDLTDAFWSIKIRDEDIPKTAFISRQGLWEFVSMPFGLTNAPATQQRFIESILQGLIWECCFAYIDDILCFSNSFDNHLNDMRRIFQRLKDNNLVLQPSKCSICTPTFEILGYVATKDGLKPSKRKVEAMMAYPYPRSVKEAESFLGIVSWLRRFIPHCSAATRHLRQCSKLAPTNFALSEEAKKEVDRLKEILCANTCLAHPDTDKQFFIHVDASKKGLGAILTQLDESGKHRVIEYASKSLNNAQTKYSNSIREALGVLWSLQHFRYYIHGRKPIVYCDCKCLSQLFGEKSTKIPNIDQLRDWVARLLHYQPRVVHKPGRMMAIPDALSRHYVEYLNEDVNDSGTSFLGSLIDEALKHKKPQGSLEAQADLIAKLLPPNEDVMESARIRTLNMNLRKRKRASTSSDSSGGSDGEEDDNQLRVVSKLAREQRLDPELSDLIDYMQSGTLPKSHNRASYLKSVQHQYTIDVEGILRKIDVKTPKGSDLQDTPPAMLPRSMWDEVIKHYHDSPFGGHRKFKKLLASMRRTFFFHGMGPYLKAYCDQCASCQCSTVSKRKYSPLKPYYASYPGVLVHLDCTPGSKTTARGNSHILAIIDSFTGHVRLYPLGNPNSRNVARSLLSYISLHSMPLKIITDNGPEFANELMTELSLMLGIKQIRTSPYNSQANGKVENIHRTVQTMMRAFIEDYSEDWDLLLPLLEFAVNTSPSDVTGYTPFFLSFGRHPIMPLDALTGSIYKPDITVDDYVKKLKAERENVFQWVSDRKKKAAEQMSDAYKKAHPSLSNTPPFKEGDIVRLRNEGRRGYHGQKYNPLYSRDLYIVTEDLKNTSFKIQDLQRSKPEEVRSQKQLKKVTVRHEVNFNMHDDTVASNETYVLDDSTDPEEEAGSYTVHQIIGKRSRKGQTEYLVWWKGYKKASADWQPEGNLADCQDLVNDFEKANQQGPTNAKRKKKK